MTQRPAIVVAPCPPRKLRRQGVRSNDITDLSYSIDCVAGSPSPAHCATLRRWPSREIGRAHSIVTVTADTEAIWGEDGKEPGFSDKDAPALDRYIAAGE